MKRKTALVLFGLAIAGVLLVHGISKLGLASESQVLKKLRAHRETFEQLREMMLSEKSFDLIGDGWVMVEHKAIRRTDPNFPLEKYTPYHALLTQAEALAMKRSLDPALEINFLLDGAGFAGERMHTGVCWRNTSPDHLVSTFRSYHWPPYGSERYSIYIRVAGDWYLWRD